MLVEEDSQKMGFGILAYRVVEVGRKVVVRMLVRRAERRELLRIDLNIIALS